MNAVVAHPTETRQSDVPPPPASESRLQAIALRQRELRDAANDTREYLDKAVRTAEHLIGRIEGVYDDSKGFGFERSDCVSLVRMARRVRSHVSAARLTFETADRAKHDEGSEKPIPFVPREEATPAPAPPNTIEPLGPYTIACRIEGTMQRLELLDWALNSKLDGGASDREVFLTPLAEVMRELETLREEVLQRDLAPFSHWEKKRAAKVQPVTPG